MRVKVLYYATFRQITGIKEEDVEMKDGSKIRDLLFFLFQKYGEDFKSNVMENEKIRSAVKILLNGRDIDFIKGLDTELKPGDSVYFFPSIAGGF